MSRFLSHDNQKRPHKQENVKSQKPGDERVLRRRERLTESNAAEKSSRKAESM